MAHVAGYGDDFFRNQDPEPYLFQSDNELSVTNASNDKNFMSSKRQNQG